jgi:hypothetical protein
VQNGKRELSTESVLSYQLLLNINTRFKEQDDVKLAESSAKIIVDKALDKWWMNCGKTPYIKRAVHADSAGAHV